MNYHQILKKYPLVFNCLQHMIASIILIDAQDFINKMNPYEVTEHIYKVPRLRNIDGCVKEWNKQRSKAERYIHADEISAFLKKDCTVFKYKFGNRWIINYDQLEPYLKEISKRKMETSVGLLAQKKISQILTKMTDFGLPETTRTSAKPDLGGRCSLLLSYRQK